MWDILARRKFVKIVSNDNYVFYIARDILVQTSEFFRRE